MPTNQPNTASTQNCNISQLESARTQNCNIPQLNQLAKVKTEQTVLKSEPNKKQARKKLLQFIQPRPAFGVTGNQAKQRSVPPPLPSPPFNITQNKSSQVYHASRVHARLCFCGSAAEMAHTSTFCQRKCKLRTELMTVRPKALISTPLTWQGNAQQLFLSQQTSSLTSSEKNLVSGKSQINIQLSITFISEVNIPQEAFQTAAAYLKQQALHSTH
jgi:hypothetical protein